MTHDHSAGPHPSGVDHGRRTRWAPALLTALVLAALIAVIAVLLPALIVTPETVADAAKRLELQNQVRATLLQGIGGMAILGGAYVTWRQLRLSREQFLHSLENNTAQLRLAREAQITEQFSAATEQLGHEALRVRVAGVYSLEQLATSATDLRPVIHELFGAYLRAESPWSQHDPTTLTAIYPEAEAERTSPPTTFLLNVRAPDRQAVMTVLGRRHATSSDEVIDLQGVDLGGVYLIGADVGGIDFGRAMMAWAQLDNADLSNANLARANLHRARLRNADLRGAVLKYAVLSKADVAGADLRGTDLTQADLRDARCDGATRWPEGFDWRSAGVLAPHSEQ